MCDALFDYSNKWKLMVCKRCRAGVFIENMVGHLSGKAHRMIGKEVKRVVDEVKERYKLVSAEDWVVVREVEEEVNGLMPKVDGFRCIVRDADENECGFCYGTKTTMEKHWTNDHVGLKGEKGNRSKEKLRELQEKKMRWYTKVKVQRFGETGDLKTWFWVREEEEREREVIEETVKERMMREFIAERERMDKLKVKYIIAGEGGREMIPWLKTMGWERYIVKMDVDRRWLLTLGAEVGDNPKEKVIWDSIGRVLKMSEELVGEMGDKVLRDLVRSEREHRADGKKMERYKHVNEMDDKGRWLKRLVMVLVRNGGEVGLLNVTFGEEEREQFREMMEYAEYVVREDGDLEIIDGEHEREKRQEERERKIRRGEMRKGKGEVKVKVFGLDLRVLRFVMAMVRRTSNMNEYRLSMVCALAVVGVKESGWMTAVRCGPVLSGILKCLRLMLLVECFQGEEVVEKDEEWIENEEGFPLAEMVEERVNRWMVRGTRGAGWWLLEKRAYAMNVGMTETAEGQMSWRDGGERVIDGDIEFTMDGLRGMIWGLIEEGRKSLKQVVFGRNSRDGKERDGELPVIRWDDLRDDSNRSEIGFSFVKYERNRWTVDGETWLMEKMVDEKRVTDGSGRWDWKKMGMWLDEVVVLKEWLLLLTHLCCGQPSRGPEILGTRWCSGGEGEGRNIFVEDGDLVSVLRDHKGSWKGGLKVILRYFPREVGELMVWYLWLVVRCAEVWEGRWRKQQQNEEEEEVDSDSESESDEDESGEMREQRKTRENEDREMRKERREWRGNTLIWGEDYDGKLWDENRLRKLLVRSFEDGLNVKKMGVAKWRHVVIGISRYHLREKMEEEEEDREKIIDEQAGHSSGMAERIYGRMMSERGGESEGKRAKFRQISEEWFRFLKLMVSEKSGKRKRMTANEEVMLKYEERMRREAIKGLNLDTLLMEKTGMVFRGKQKEIIELVQHGEERVLGVMKTGGGKSLVFMLWGLTPGNGMTVVVVPLVVLKDDLVERCRAMGIDVAGWDWKNQPMGRRMVVVVMEASIGEEFSEFLRKVKENRRLDRIVIDEVHMVMNESETFRPKLRELGALNRWEVPIVMLSGTIPVTMETRLIERMNMTRDDVTVVRGETGRRELVWRVYEMRERGWNEKKDELEALVMKKKRKVERWGGGCILIYCASVREVKYWGKRLDGQVYWSESEHKMDVVRWLKGGRMRGRDEEETVKIVVGSSAFGMGVDVKDIRVVIFMYEVEGMLDFVQGGGRAGRGGQKSEVVMVRGNGKMGRPDERRVKDEGWMEMTEWINGGECRRVVMGRYLDGDAERVECRDGEMKCDVCGNEEDLEDGLEEEIEDQEYEEGEEGEEDEENEEETREEEMEREMREKEKMEREREIQMERERKERERREREEREREEREREEKRVREEEASRIKLTLLARRRDEEKQEERKMVRKTERWLKTWKENCMFCEEEMDGEEDDDDDTDDESIDDDEFERRRKFPRHRLMSCRKWRENIELQQRVDDDMRIRWEKMGGCFDCGIWFGVCDKWVERPSGGVGSQSAGGGLYDIDRTKRYCDMSMTVVWILNWIGLNDPEWEMEEKARLERIGSSPDGWRGEMKRKVTFGGKDCYEGMVMVMKYFESARSREGPGRWWFYGYYEEEKE